MNDFTERAAVVTDAPWLAAAYAAPHARAFVQQPSEAIVRAALERGETTERIVLDTHGVPVALWRAALEEPWLAEIRTLVAVVPGIGAGRWALRRALAWAFEEHAVHRAFLYVVAANARARRLYERCGFRLEGTHRDGFRNPSGGYEDLCFYGMLAHEYQEIT